LQNWLDIRVIIMELSLPNFYQGKNKIKIQLSKQPSYIYCYSTLNMEKKRDKKMSNKQPTYLYIYTYITTTKIDYDYYTYLILVYR